MFKKFYWSKDEKETLRSMARDGSAFVEICKALPNRTPKGVLWEARYLSSLDTGITPKGLQLRRDDQTNKISQIYIERGREWTSMDNRLLTHLFITPNSLDQICDTLGRSRTGIVKHIEELCKNPDVDLSYSKLFNKIRKYLVCNKRI